jgi:leader peptidase (prepilin peptidase) / N-methyltransferase
MTDVVPIASFAFLGGMITGSFVGVVAHRLPLGRSFVGGRSECPSCGAQIAAYDNVPVLSWLLLGGHCRSCNARIPARYPLIELAVGLAFAATTLVLYDDPAALALGLVFVAVLAAITLTDLERRVIPNAILLVGALIGLGIVAATDPGSLPERLAAAAGAGGFLLIAALLYPRGMGMGDVKLAAVMGVFLGVSVVPALFVAIALGSVVGFGLMLRYGPAARKHAVPFGPFLAVGGVVGLLAGGQMIDAYLSHFVG